MKHLLLPYLHKAFFISWSTCFTLAYAGSPLWVMTPDPSHPPTQTIPINASAKINYFISNQSSHSGAVLIQPMQGVEQTAACSMSPKGQGNDTCTLTLSVSGQTMPASGITGGPVICAKNPDGSPNENLCYQPTPQHVLHLTQGDYLPSTLTLSPTSLHFLQNATDSVTITNSIDSPEAALNVHATLPPASNLSVQSNTCGASLAIGASCTIVFASGATEGPTQVTLQGDNTFPTSLNITISPNPTITISGPVQSSRVVAVSGSALDLQITNDASSALNANNMTVSNQAGCASLIVDPTDCTSVAPGNSCALHLTSNTPYAPCTITISGSNTANSPTTVIGFTYLGGMVFQGNGSGGKIVIDQASQSTSKWTNSYADIVGTNTTNGSGNTDLIVADASCSASPANCAAQRCRNIGAQCYLPAYIELTTIRSVLCPSTCIFSNFSGVFYWSSTQTGSTSAYSYQIPGASISNSGKLATWYVRCVRAY